MKIGPHDGTDIHAGKEQSMLHVCPIDSHPQTRKLSLSSKKPT